MYTSICFSTDTLTIVVQTPVSQNEKNQITKPPTWHKNKTLAQVFSCEFFEISEISKNTFFTEYLRAIASGISYPRSIHYLCPGRLC